RRSNTQFGDQSAPTKGSGGRFGSTASAPLCTLANCAQTILAIRDPPAAPLSRSATAVPSVFAAPSASAPLGAVTAPSASTARAPSLRRALPLPERLRCAERFRCPERLHCTERLRCPQAPSRRRGCADSIPWPGLQAKPGSVFGYGRPDRRPHR